MITATNNITKLSYRLYQDSDMQSVLELWEKYSGWGAITEEQFTKWCINTPYGKCLIIIAVDNVNKVVGQMTFVPSLVYIEGNEVKALRASAPILQENSRQKNIKDYDHPVFAMFRYGMQVAKKQEYSLVYVFPAFAWTSVFRLFPQFDLPYVQVSSFDCFSISLEDKDTYILERNSLIVDIHKGEFSNEYNELWDDAVGHFPICCSVVRKASWLKWKIQGHSVFEVRCTQKNILNGYIAINKKSGLIVDMLARTKEDSQKVINAVVQYLHYSNPDRIPEMWKEITGMYTPVFQSILQNTKHEMKNFRFGFACYPLNESINNSIQPSSWYMMPND